MQGTESSIKNKKVMNKEEEDNTEIRNFKEWDCNQIH